MIWYNFPRYCLPEKHKMSFLSFLYREGWPAGTIQASDGYNTEGFQDMP